MHHYKRKNLLLMLAAARNAVLTPHLAQPVIDRSRHDAIVARVEQYADEMQNVDFSDRAAVIAPGRGLRWWYTLNGCSNDEIKTAAQYVGI